MTRFSQVLISLATVYDSWAQRREDEKYRNFLEGLKEDSKYNGVFSIPTKNYERFKQRLERENILTLHGTDSFGGKEVVVVINRTNLLEALE